MPVSTATPTYTPTNTPTDVPVDCLSWEFNEGHAEGWNATHDLSGSRVTPEGYLTGTVVDDDPFWDFREVVPPIDTNILKNLKIRYRINASNPNNKLQLFWKIDQQYVGGQWIEITIQPDDTWHTLEANLSTSSWTGTVTHLRLDPVQFGSNGDTVEIDYIKICPTP